MSSVDEVKKRILQNVPLDALIGEVVSLQRKSGHKVGLCPFHEEKTPSFTVYPESYFCFGCKKSGDAISFVREMQGLGFIEALKFLADKYGIDASELNESDRFSNRKNEELRLFEAMNAAQQFFTKNLLSAAGKPALDYLTSRNFSIDDINNLGFGFALDHSWSLQNYLNSLRFSNQELDQCSLISRSQRNENQFYDFFRNRITIPIRDQYGRIIAFGGRAMGDFLPKYKNSRESLIFNKSLVLFGFDKAKEKIRRGEPAILVEGYMDVFRLWLNGFAGAVACMGTSPNVQHLKMISNFTKQLYLVFDGDQAGQKTTLSSISLGFEVPSLSLGVIELPEKHDPDSFIQEYGKHGFEQLLDEATDLIDYVIKNRIMNAGSFEIPEILNKEIIPWLARCTDTMQRAYLISKVAFLTGIDKNNITEKLNQFFNSPRQEPKTTLSNKEPVELERIRIEELDLIEDAFVGHVYFSQTTDIDIPKLKQFIEKHLTLGPGWQDLVKDMLLVLESGRSPSALSNEELLTWKSLVHDDLLKYIKELSNRSGAFEVKDRRDSIIKIIASYKKKKFQSQIAFLKTKLQQAKNEEQGTILRAIVDLNTELTKL